MSLNLLNPQVGDIIGASSTTYDTPIVEFPIGRFIVLRKPPVMEDTAIDYSPADCCGRMPIIR